MNDSRTSRQVTRPGEGSGDLGEGRLLQGAWKLYRRRALLGDPGPAAPT
jgi:hypothetical protein